MISPIRSSQHRTATAFGGRADRRPQTGNDLRARIRATPVSGTPAKMRAAFARLTGPAPDLARDSVAGIPVARIGQGPSCVLWLHGGGYVFGSPESHAAAASFLASALKATVIVPDYPLAPEAVWPAQLDAVAAVLDALVGPVGVVGDSAGGHLALNLALHRPGRLAALCLISPNTDRSGRSTTRGRDTDLMNEDAQDTRLARMAFPGHADASPTVSPLLADLGGLAPLQILAAGNEILLDDAALLARAAALSGVSVDFRVWPGLFHMWPLWPEALPEARAALGAVAAHLRAALPPHPTPSKRTETPSKGV